MVDVEALARSYFDRVRERDAAAIGQMYAADGVLRLPTGQEVQGPAAVEAFYRALFATTPPTPAVAATITEGRRCLVELVVRQSSGAPAYAADAFTFDDEGLIAELAIYARTAA